MRGSPREISALLHDWNAAESEPAPILVESSGSTGLPKRVVLSRGAMRASASATHDRLGGPGQWMLSLPPSHVAGTQVLFRSVLARTEPTVRDEHDDLATAVAAMTGARRYVSLVPTQLTRLLASGSDTDALRRFDAILVGGASVDRGLRACAERAGLTVVATYGMSETCGGCVYDGVPLDGVAVALSSGGQVRIAGPVLFDGYDGQPDVTAEVLVDGWYHTSDVGRIDQDGRLQLLGRIDDVVISGGVNVPTPAVAARLNEHHALVSVEVVGVPDDDWGRRVVAVVVPTTSGAPSLEELRDFVGTTLPRTWAPRDVVVVDEIPLLHNGKVDRKAVERIAESESGGPQHRIARISTEEIS